jgi:hypothetical protein
MESAAYSSGANCAVGKLILLQLAAKVGADRLFFRRAGHEHAHVKGVGLTRLERGV